MKNFTIFQYCNKKVIRDKSLSLISFYNKYDFIYTSKFNSKSIDKKCSFKIVKNKVSRLNGTVSFFTNYNKNTRIDEEIKDSVLYSTLKDEEKDSLERLKDIVRERLERKYG